MSLLPQHNQLGNIDLDAEAVCLSWVLAGQSPSALDGLEPHHFYSDANRLIYESVLLLLEEGRTADTVSVAGSLRARRKFKQAGGAAYLGQIELTPSAVNVEQHARTVREKWESRQLQQAASTATIALSAGEQTALVASHLSVAVEQARTASQKRRPSSPSDVIGRWRTEGELTRVPSGLKMLDELSGGGVLVPRRIVLVGAPSAGKTYLEMLLARNWSRSDGPFCAGIMAIDEDDSDLTVRLAQMAGFFQNQCERRNHQILDGIEASLEEYRLRFFDSSWTIEDASEYLGRWASEEGRAGLLCVDSLHTVQSVRSRSAETRREMVESNVSALRACADRWKLTLMVTAEMNRAGYASAKYAADANPLASAAEARATEYFAQTLIALTCPREHPELVRAVVAKNRGARRGEFWLQFDHPNHAVCEVDGPEEDVTPSQMREASKRAQLSQKYLEDTKLVARIIQSNPGISSTGLRIELGKLGCKWGRDKMSLIFALLEDGSLGVRLLDRPSPGPKGNERHWYLEPVAGASTTVDS